MKLLTLIKDRLIARKKQSNINELNNKCNTHFNRIFDKCRIQFGKQLVSVVEIKNSMLSYTEINNIAGNELIVNKLFSLILIYFELVEDYVDMGDELFETKQNFMFKINEIYNLIQNLNLNIKMNSNLNDDNYQDIINEATALKNVLRNNRNKHI